MDVWFDSGVTHYFVLAQQPHLQEPADLYLEGSDQHRGWFQSSLLTSVAINARAPYKAVLTHGFTVDAKGKKMSKSVGNVVSPQEIMKTLGADIIRLWVASTDYRNEMTVSEEILKRMADAYRRIRNTVRFMLSNLNGFEPAEHLLPAEDMIAVDRWAVDRAAHVQSIVTEAYDSYQFHLVYQQILQFCVVEMGSFYLDIIKDRQYTTQENSNARRSAQTALYHIVQAMTRWIAPIMCFTADEIWKFIPGEKGESVHLETWYDQLFSLNDTDALSVDNWAQVMQVKSVVNKQMETLRADGLGSSLQAEVVIYCDGSVSGDLLKLQNELRFAMITSVAEVKPLAEKPEDAVATTMDNVWLGVTISEQPKCDRCWHHREDVGQTEAHPELCNRCVDNVDGDGESREFV